MDKNMFICFAVAFITSLVITYGLIPVLRFLKFGQTIRDEGPQWHNKKSGTPTMGGIGFLIVTVVLTLIHTTNPAVKFGCIFAGLYGVIGFMDDGIKIILKRNLGLTEKQKLILQVLVSVVFLVVGVNKGYIETTISIPFTSIVWDLKWFYVIFMAIYMIAYTNAVNLTDGLDGLATSVTTVVGIFFIFSSIVLDSEVSFFAVSLTGALIGFLVFNFYPAKVFMGDTGSLFLGGAVAVMAILLKIELILILAGIIYVIEALSVVIQVAYFKKTGGKRIFLMAPIHHHFEMKKMSEIGIVSMFTGITFVACILAAFSII